MRHLITLCVGHFENLPTDFDFVNVSTYDYTHYNKSHLLISSVSSEKLFSIMKLLNSQRWI